MPPSLPARLGRYEVVGHLATGGMAEIFLCKLHGPSGFERPVVVKRILPYLARQKQFVDMFVDEARIISRIRHPNVVQVQELAQDDGELLLVLEYLEGESVASLMRRAKLTGISIAPALAAHMVSLACTGLHAAHELLADDGTPFGLVHRDVSPQNLFVTFAGEVKVLDFGIAKAKDRESRTEAGQSKGKLEYMSPEQSKGEPLDRRSDVFALGIVLYELVTGKRLFRRGSPMATLDAIHREPVIPPSRTTEGIPPELDRIVLTALARSPDGRFATAAEMARHLQIFARAQEPGALEGERVAALMQQLFSDRRAEKAELLRRVRVGAPVGELPEAEVDGTVELPAVVAPATEIAMTLPLAPTYASAPVSGRSGSLAVAAIAGGAVLAVAGSALYWSTHRAQQIADVDAAPTTATAAATAPQPPEVRVVVDTDPPGCEVLVDGTLRGTSPLQLPLARSTEAVRLVVQKAGFEPYARTFAPNRDEQVMVRLRASPTALPSVARPTAGGPRPSAAPTASATSTVRKWD
ncbi:MAG: serine/threonine protein kinase [Polyangiaceae bacterium]|nr:serine/threonine protein kinase [Polyangiaceae bacterium]